MGNQGHFRRPIASLHIFLIFFLVTAILLLAGCTTQPGTIFNEFSLPDETSVLTGARQRAITNIDIKTTSRPGLVDPKRIVCAEPSPDVSIALANSFGFGLSGITGVKA